MTGKEIMSYFINSDYKEFCDIYMTYSGESHANSALSVLDVTGYMRAYFGEKTTSYFPELQEYLEVYESDGGR